MKNQIEVETREHYGTAHIYVTSDHAAAIAALTGRKTVTASDIKALKALGFSFAAKQPALSF